MKTYRLALESYGPESQRLLAGLDMALSCRNTREARMSLHALKGIAATVGATEAAKRAALLEAQFKVDFVEVDDDELLQLKDVVALSVITLKDRLHAEAGNELVVLDQATTYTPADLNTWMERVNALSNMLLAANMRALEEVEALVNEAPFEFGDFAAELLTLVENLKFAEAASLIKAKLGGGSSDQ